MTKIFLGEGRRMELSGKVALVTGSGRNIGRSIALELARCGADVIVNTRSNQDEANRVVKEIEAIGQKAIPFLADVGDKIELEKMLKQALTEFGQIDVVVNNAVYLSEYRKIINQSKIMLGFFTKSNLDEYSIRSFEITACGSFLLSERTRFQKRFFREDKEAGYFDGIDECAEKIKYYLANPLERIKLELSGYRRAQELDLTNDYVVKRALSKLFRDSFNPF